MKNARRGCNYCTHAEMDALSKYSRIFSRKRNYKNRKACVKMDMIVIRINDRGQLRNSKPCSKCLEIMNVSRSCRIENIYYSTNNGEIIKEKFVDLFERRDQYVTPRFRN